MKRNVKGRSVASGIVLLAATVAACSGEETGERSQVVATVNESEITISQLRATLLARGETEPSPETARQTLEGLVNEQLLVDAALRSDLDRDPAVVQAMEAARRQILANAFVERLVYPHAEISAAEQAAYYREHPELFAKRRIYQLDSFTCPPGELPAGVMAALETAQTSDAVAGVLEAHHLVCTTQALTRAAEQLALAQLGRFALAEPGDVVVQHEEGGANVLMLIAGIQESPLAFEQAQPIIEQYLSNVRNAEALDAHLKQARATASVTRSDTTLFASAEVEPAAATAPAPTAAHAEDTGAAILN